MTILVADIGGTNARLALGQHRLRPGTLMRLRIADHAGLDAALDHYLTAQGNPPLTAACLAVAGPVSGGQARLTNSGWTADATRLSAQLGAPVALLNDLAALGHALPHLDPGATHLLQPASRPQSNGQSVVLGLGTGVNVAAVIQRPGQPAAILAAEAGHLALPHRIAQQLSARIGANLAYFPTTEDLFSGRGLSRLHQCLHGPALPPEALAADPRYHDTFALYAHLLGLWLQEIALMTLPQNGIWLAGSVAQALVRAGLGPTIATTFSAPNPNKGPPCDMALHLITDDLAALTGCLAAIQGA